MSRRPKCSYARRTASNAAARSVTSSRSGSSASPYSAASSSSALGSRAVPATRSPRCSAALAHSRPKPRDVPVMNHVLLPMTSRLARLVQREDDQVLRELADDEAAMAVEVLPVLGEPHP